MPCSAPRSLVADAPVFILLKNHVNEKLTVAASRPERKTDMELKQLGRPENVVACWSKNLTKIFVAGLLVVAGQATAGTLLRTEE